MPDSEVYEFHARPAKREGVGLFVGVNGGTGSGKTYTALRLARGIVGPNGRILGGDTEGRRMSHYAGETSPAGIPMKFDTVDIEPLFRPGKFEALIKYAEAQKYDVVVIDSFSHEHAGEGGTNEWHDEICERAVLKAKQAADHPEQVNEEAVWNAANFRAWVDPKVAHKAMVNSFLQRRIPIIFCMRAEEKMKMVGNKPVPQGWQPICDKNFGYELTVMVTLSNENPGKTDYKLPRKIQQQHLHLFKDGQYITEEAGAKLAAWARGEDISPTAKKPEPQKAAPALAPATPTPATPSTDRTTGIADALIQRINEKTTSADIEAVFTEDMVAKQVAWMMAHRKDQYDRVMKAADDKNVALNTAPPPDDIPTDAPPTETEIPETPGEPAEGETTPG